MTKLTQLIIGPVTSYLPISKTNPLIAKIKLESEHSTIETVLSEEVMIKILNLCQEEIVNEAKRNVDEFISTVTAIEPDETKLLETVE